MRLRTKLLWAMIILCATAFAAAAYWYGSAPRRDLIAETAKKSVHEARHSRSATQLREAVGRWWRKMRSQTRREPYALDEMSRGAVRQDGGGLECPDVELGTYTGDAVGYTRPLTVNAHFKARLGRFEAIAADVGREVYGRPPSRVIHFGAYNCRTLRHKKSVLSEHAFGNALDVAGFEFDAVDEQVRGEFGRAGDAFEVSVLQHWDAGQGFAARHSVFLKELVQRLERDRVFRGMIVPPAPGHHDHLHLDMGWWVYLNGDPSL